MHFSFWEKLAFGLLVTAWVTWGSIMLGDILVHADESQVAALRLTPAEGADTAKSKEAPAEMDLATVLQQASPDRGKKVFKKCAACHTPEQGGKNKVGPNLWNVLTRSKATAEAFKYSDVLKGLGGEWTYEDVDAYLTSPRKYAPGNKMTFAGLKKQADRAAVIVYLRSLSDSPKPLP